MRAAIHLCKQRLRRKSPSGGVCESPLESIGICIASAAPEPNGGTYALRSHPQQPMDGCCSSLELSGSCQSGVRQ